VRGDGIISETPSSQQPEKTDIVKEGERAGKDINVYYKQAAAGVEEKVLENY